MPDIAANPPTTRASAVCSPCHKRSLETLHLIIPRGNAIAIRTGKSGRVGSALAPFFAKTAL
jgi:hypothetical protein